MGLSLTESVAVGSLVDFVYDLLPGSGMSQWKGHVSFKTIAQKVGVGSFWQEGSKKPMLTNLFEKTLASQRQLFEPLILEIVRAGIPHSRKNNRPLYSQDIEQLNAILLRLGFKFPELWDQGFLNSLGTRKVAAASEQSEQSAREKKDAADKASRTEQLLGLKERFFQLFAMSNRQAAGLELEKVLNELFEVHGLSPRQPFRITGEQIDGSFELDHDIYLVEAKWEKEPMPEKDLLVFRGKIEGKSAFTRGVFISLSGVSSEANKAITYGKQPTFFVVDGYDLTMALEDRVDLKDFLRQRRRLLSEEGRVCIPFGELWSGSRGQHRAS